MDHSQLKSFFAALLSRGATVDAMQRKLSKTHFMVYEVKTAEPRIYFELDLSVFRYSDAAACPGLTLSWSSLTEKASYNGENEESYDSAVNRAIAFLSSAYCEN
jgi:uncharacterized protein YtpQ (UPF0354 family)